MEAGWRETSQAIDANCFHTRLFFTFARKTVIDYMGGESRGSLPPRPLEGDGRSAPFCSIG
jgi:hypothetical protein